MTKSKRVLTILACIALAALLLLGLFAGCSAKQELAYAPEPKYDGLWREAYTEAEADYGNIALSNMMDYRESPEIVQARTTATTGGGESDGRFVIARAEISIQTKTYDAFTAALKAGLKAMGGYTDSYDEWNFDTDRRASITARVPSQKLDAFLESLEENGTVMSRSVTTTDVTDEMIETGSKKEALKNEETALLAILEKAQTVEDIIRVQDRLTNVRAELQAYSQKLQSLTNQVNYSAVQLEVREVERITKSQQKFGALASSGFLGSLREIGQGLLNFALWFISAIPYLVMLALPAAILVIVIRRVRRNRRAKKAGM